MNLKPINNRNSNNSSRVFINVYDLHPANNYSHCLGFGVYHSGVEINNIEYSFNGHEFSFSGIFEQNEPKVIPGIKFRESIYIGDITLSNKQLQSLIETIGENFSGQSYHPIKKNCNSFTSSFVYALFKRNDLVPNYINRLAYIGSYFTCFLPSNYNFVPNQNNTSNKSNNSGANSSSNNGGVVAFSGTGYSLDNGPKPIVIPNNNSDSSKLNFYGSDNDDSSGGSSEEIKRREKVLLATSKRFTQQHQQQIDNESSTLDGNVSPSSSFGTNASFSSHSSDNENSPPTISSPLIKQ